MRKIDEEKIEIDLLLDGIIKRYGYDFSDYSYSSLKRRLTVAKTNLGVSRFTELLDKVFHNDTYFDEVLKQLSVTVTEMFRDPPFYQSLRAQLIPQLKTYPFVKIWHAGCATGEEAYSLAILLHEENFLDRALIYATDYNKNSLNIAKKGIYSPENFEKYIQNYTKVTGKDSFSQYYNSKYDLVKMKDFLKERITFSYHNLVTDHVFGEMNLILCRNVLIYFNQDLQNRVYNLFNESLRHGGYLCLGNKESLKFSSIDQYFEPLDKQQRIYKKMVHA